ncbi:hypothetical protein CLAFUW4_08984 [Fulvia fulva]|nr:hypothetical protein CLAFUR4_08990 [Fulvia fulva]KAK4614323.1 hypothetical protein CLAFUR0_08982 [Fulvia fulva]WPV20603.1 hypothetical protein CLAFUW4_08984 [Fulvia fulva]WPV34724.1 hypothetical protein CLAFUW7_08985 [Fulvia fulva]
MFTPETPEDPEPEQQTGNTRPPPAHPGASIELPYRHQDSKKPEEFDDDEFLEAAPELEEPARPAHQPGAPVSDEKEVAEYSNEARVYQARYESLSDDHDNGRFAACQEGCLDLLSEPHLPRYTPAERCLLEAAEILGKMEGAKVQVKLLEDDNDLMLADIKQWRVENGLVGVDLEDTLEDGKSMSSDDYVQFDRDIEAVLEKELEEEVQRVMAYGKEDKLDGPAADEE